MPDRRYIYLWVMRKRTYPNNGHKAPWFPRPGQQAVTQQRARVLRLCVRRKNRTDVVFEHAVGQIPIDLVKILAT